MLYQVKKVVRGKLEGELIVCHSAFSFMGDVDLDTSEIIAQENENKGQKLAGKILVFTENKRFFRRFFGADYTGKPGNCPRCHHQRKGS